MALLGERVGAAKALEWGMVNRVVADGDFDAEVDALASRLSSGPTRSYAGTKRQLNAWLFSRMQEQLELETVVQQEMAASGDFAEGVAAFIQKRAAEFRGA
jgi:2-(1,2-epoxy-1,2-dihydrophenyl)acetyl-CoA isomerase